MCASDALDTADAPAEPRYREDELLPLSALQHLLFCERQCALIHIEQAWAENRLTAQGRLLHERVHEQGAESRGDIRISRAIPLRSLRLGVSGIADVVEFRRADACEESHVWHPTPIEYKRGRPKEGHADQVQLCAQAMSLEEMLGIAVPEGVIFYGATRRRLEVRIDEVLRSITMTAADRLHTLIAAGRTPPAVFEKKCQSCSLLELCMPRIVGQKSATEYLKTL